MSCLLQSAKNAPRDALIWQLARLHCHFRACSDISARACQEELDAATRESIKTKTRVRVLREDDLRERFRSRARIRRFRTLRERRARN